MIHVITRLKQGSTWSSFSNFALGAAIAVPYYTVDMLIVAAIAAMVGIIFP